LRVLSIAGIAAKLLSVLPVAEAQTTSAQCLPQYNWMNNDRNQNPCLVAAYAQGACNGGQFSVASLPEGTHYTGPFANQVNACECSTVVYSLVSACGLCQGDIFISWSDWSTNCSTVYPSVYPEPISSGTSIPAWAYLDVVKSNNFNVTEAQADDTQPASSVSASQKPTGTVSSTTASTTASTASEISSTPTLAGNGGGPTTTTTSNGTSNNSNTGAIAGGAVGGVVGLGIIAGVLAFFLMRNRRTKSAPSAEYNTGYYGGPASDAPLNTPPPMSQHSYTNQVPRLYDPSDPSTYPQSTQTPTIQTTNSGPAYSHQHQASQYSGIPEL